MSAYHARNSGKCRPVLRAPNPEEPAFMPTDLLNGLHMVAAITQATINYQFSQLFKQSVIHNTLDITMADTGIELKANLAAPTISMSLPDRQRSLLFMLNMT